MICHNMSWFIDGCPAIQFGAPVPCKPMTVVIKKERVAQTSSRASRLSMPELCITASAGYLPWVSSVPGSWPFSVDHAFPLPFSVWSCATWTNSEVQRAQTSDKLLRFYWILETWVLMVPTRRGKSQDATSTMLGALAQLPVLGFSPWVEWLPCLFRPRTSFVVLVLKSRSRLRNNDHRINWINAINMVSLILGLFDDEKGTSKWKLAQLLDSTCMFLSCILIYHDLATSLWHTEQFNVHAHHARCYRQIDLAYLHIWHAFQ